MSKVRGLPDILAEEPAESSTVAVWREWSDLQAGGATQPQTTLKERLIHYHFYVKHTAPGIRTHDTWTYYSTQHPLGGLYLERKAGLDIYS